MARKDVSMTPAEISRFLEEGRTLQVATLGRDGWPHLAPMWYVTIDDTIVFRSFTKSQKIVNLVRDPRITVLVEQGTTYADLQGVTVRGRARLVTDRDYVLGIYGMLAAKYPVLGSEPVTLEAGVLEATFGRYADKNTAVVVEAARVISWDHRKLGGAY